LLFPGYDIEKWYYISLLILNMVNRQK
jgi:hypothetical protein